MKHILYLAAAVFTIISSVFANPGNAGKGDNFPKGHLFIIGGGYRDSLLMVEFVQLAGGTGSKFLIIPNASSEPEETGKELLKEFSGYGCTNVQSVVFTRELAESDSLIEVFRDVDGIWFSGGDQVRHTAVLNNTKFLDFIREKYHTGAIIGGTSAGAAIMSKIMITGEQLKMKEDQAFVTIMSGNIEVKEGFGFLPGVIVDQHFILRRRFNRLLSVCLENPTQIGIGIDEETAIIVSDGNKFRVAGNRTVLVLDPVNSANISTNPEGLYSVENIKLSLLQAGQKYSISERRVIE